MTNGMKQLLEMRDEAMKYRGCMMAWSRAIGYENHNMLSQLFKSQNLCESHLRAIEIGATVIKQYKLREEEVIKNANIILAS